MNKTSTVLLTLTFTAGLASSQGPTGIRSAASADSQLTSGSNPARHMEAARPLLGYLTDSSNVLYSVVGTAANPLWGEPLVLPSGTAAVFLPPRQEYALLASDAGLSVARLSRSAIYPGAVIPQAMSQPAQVAFSPSGDAVALFSSVESRIQVLTHVAAESQVHWSVPLANPRELLRFTVSDDGELVVAAFRDQLTWYSLQGAAWRQLPANYQPDAWTFLPASHDLVLSDRAQKAIVILSQVERAPIAARVLSSGAIDANLLSPNKQGSQLLAVGAETSDAWSIDLLTGVIAPVPVKRAVDCLTLLRDGQTFLISTKDSPVAVKLSGAAQSAATNISH